MTKLTFAQPRDYRDDKAGCRQAAQDLLSILEDVQRAETQIGKSPSISLSARNAGYRWRNSLEDRLRKVAQGYWLTAIYAFDETDGHRAAWPLIAPALGPDPDSNLIAWLSAIANNPGVATPAPADVTAVLCVARRHLTWRAANLVPAAPIPLPVPHLRRVI